MSDHRRSARAVAVVKIVCVAQLLALAVAVPIALTYRSRASNSGGSGGPDVDHQYTAIGWALAAGAAVLCLIVLGAGLRRWWSCPGRGRSAIITAHSATLIGVLTVNAAISNPLHAHELATRLLVLMAFADVVVLVAINLPSARGKSKQMPPPPDGRPA